MFWVNLASWVPCTEVEGPGKRAAIWVQGCDKRCQGCCNPHYLVFEERQLVKASELANWILDAAKKYNLEGVTFLGGEPLLQAQGLAVIASTVKSAGLSVMVFSGYSLNELSQLGLVGTKELLAHTDVLIDGVYDNLKLDTKRQWVGSSNQSFNYLSDFYDASIESTNSLKREVELHISTDGKIILNGWPELL